MKREKTLLGALALMAAGFLFAAPAAQAQTPLDTISNGGVTCKQYATTYDWQTAATDTFWDCINTSSPPTSFEKLVPRKAKDLPSTMKTTLVDVEIMIFQNRSDFASFTGETAPAPKYMAWIAPGGPSGTSLSSKRIAAVFAEASLWSTADDQVATRNITALYDVNVMQAIGRHYDQLTGNPSLPSETPIHIFAIATEYDQFWTDQKEIDEVWDSDIEAAFPSLVTPWQILNELYGASYADIYAFQFAQEFSANYGHLNGFMNSWLKETTGYRYFEIFQHPSPIRPVSGAYKIASGSSPAIGVMCVEYELTTYDAPADKLWDCIRPYNSAYGGQRQSGQGVHALSTTIKNTLDSSGVKLYLMRDATHHRLLHENTVDSVLPSYLVNAWGLSTGVDSGVNRISSAFWRAFTKDDYSEFITTPSGYYQSTLVHEVSHHLDGIWKNGGDRESKHQDFNDAVFADTAYIESIACTAIFSSAICNAYQSIDQQYTSIFSGIPNVDAEDCADVLSPALCALPNLSNTDRFLTLGSAAVVNKMQCSDVFASQICSSHRKSNPEIFAWKWSSLANLQEVWALGFQVTAPTPGPYDLETAMNKMDNVRNYMSDVQTNGDPH